MREIIFKGDKYNMNWIRPDYEYAKVTCPKEIKTEVSNQRDGDTIYTEIKLTNTSKKPYFTHVGDISISFPLPDKYDDSDTCMEQRCHTHIFCGGNVSYIMALRMGDSAPHLGMVLTEGSLTAYSVERDWEKMSNDRGCFLLHPSSMQLDAGESKSIRWTIFPHHGVKDFQTKLESMRTYIKIEMQHYVMFEGEEQEIRITPSFKPKQIRFCGKTLQSDGEFYSVAYKASECGEKRLEICADEIHTWCTVYVQKHVCSLAASRCSFIAEKQQYHGCIKSLDGAYLAYDNEEETLVYTPENDYNGGRERVGMGLLILKYLQKAHEEKNAKRLETSLLQYISFVKRELVDITSGVVCNDVGMDNSYKRLYNSPWFAELFCEMYHKYRNKDDLKYAFRIVKNFYQEGGVDFYPIELPVVMLDKALLAAGMDEEEQEIKQCFIEHAERIIKTGLSYPASEVNFEQSIVAPAADILLQVYLITGTDKYLQSAIKQMKILELFQGIQPDWHLHETAIRHWDGYWFGKRRNYGDTFPHYWSALTGNVFEMYAKITGNENYLLKAENSRRGVLPMIFPDGSASSAYVYPHSINGKSGAYYDPYANDQDWGLYFYLRALIDNKPNNSVVSNHSGDI